jgi:hypothetical protein
MDNFDISSSLSSLQIKAIEIAKDRYKYIEPVKHMHTFDDRSFTIWGNKMLFWFNTSDHSTHDVFLELTNI